MKDFVPPSGLLDEVPRSKVSAFNKNYNNTPLRVGVVVKIHEVGDDANLSKLFTEYDIVTSESNQELGQGFVHYSNCISADSFGGIADFLEYKLRKSKDTDFRDNYDFKLQDGSMVIMLCIDGSTDRGIIIGGVPNVNRGTGAKTTLTPDKGHHLEGEFNGVNWQINKDGEFTVTFKSATDNKGVPQDDAAGGTTLQIDKTGSVNLNTGAGTSLTLDKPSKDASIVADNNINLLATKDIGIIADGEFAATIKKDITFEAEGKAQISAKSSIVLKAEKTLLAKGKNIIMEAQTLVAFKAPQLIINSPKTFIGPGGNPALLNSTYYIGIGNLGGPVLSTALGPFSQNVFL